MLFNSFGFILVFLPATLLGFFAIARRIGPVPAAAWLGLASLVFYGWWNPRLVVLLLASILFNYLAGRAIAARTAAASPGAAQRLLVGAITANLLLLGLFKYADFFIVTANQLAGTHWPATGLILPLGISFFTFTQIAFLVDVRRGVAREYRFVHYLLFVTWFPHLIAGPVLHHAQVMPQFAAAGRQRPLPRLIAAGFTLFCLGLAKKVLLADSFGDHAAPVFAAAEAGRPLTTLAAWAGMVAYALQLYFDFSGYCDMACGLSLMFGVRLPLNFDSPYQAASIIDFWRRWHITLSQFLRDYLYVPLGGNRQGRLRRYRNLMITMLLGGLWHGASWNFIVWGALHGALLLLNHGWRAVRAALGFAAAARPSIPGRVVGTLLTFVAVVVAWVPFRAADLPSAARLLGAAFTPGVPALWREGVDGFIARSGVAFDRWLAGLPPTLADIDAGTGLPLLVAGIAIVMFAPNAVAMMGPGVAWREPGAGAGASALPGGAALSGGSALGSGAAPRRPSALRWRPNAVWMTVTGLLLGLSLLNLSRVSPFLYFQF
jgi:D-alanyl-lipoteichoic acid acyltransferase DltB (MBOAT superfamily)